MVSACEFRCVHDKAQHVDNVRPENVGSNQVEELLPEHVNEHFDGGLNEDIAVFLLSQEHQECLGVVVLENEIEV